MSEEKNIEEGSKSQGSGDKNDELAIGNQRVRHYNQTPITNNRLR